jgi:hypothetical protein
MNPGDSTYFSLGAGLFTTMLGHNPDGFSTRITEEYRGMGLYNTRGSSFMPISIGLGF